MAKPQSSATVVDIIENPILSNFKEGRHSGTISTLVRVRVLRILP